VTYIVIQPNNRTQKTILFLPDVVAQLANRITISCIELLISQKNIAFMLSHY